MPLVRRSQVVIIVAGIVGLLGCKQGGGAGGTTAAPIAAGTERGV